MLPKRALWRTKKRALLWALCLLLMTAGALWLSRSTQINASILAMLPRSEQHSALSQQLQDGFLQRLDRQVIFLVKADQTQLPLLEDFAQALEQSGLFARLDAALSPEFMQHYGRELLAWRASFIDDQLRAKLSAEDGKARAEEVTAALFSAFAGLSGAELARDPLLLLRGYAQNAGSGSGNRMAPQDGWLTVLAGDGTPYRFIRGELKSSGFSLQDNERTAAEITAIADSFQAQGLEILRRGTVFYSARAAAAAQSDITVLGSISVLLVFVLIAAVFRSLLPLLLVLLSCAGGAVCALFAVLLIFPEVHLMTLILSVSIVGISVDYSLYYLTARLTDGAEESPEATLERLQKPLLLALGSTLCAYLALCLAPFGAIRQMAVFAMAGLCGAFMTVCCFHPYLSAALKPRPLPARPAIALLLCGQKLSLRCRLVIFALILGVCALGISHSRFGNDLHAFQSLPEDLAAMDHKIVSLTGQSADQKWVALSAADDETLLGQLASVRTALDTAVSSGLLGAYQTIRLNSRAVQEQDFALVRRAAHTTRERLRQFGAVLPEDPYADLQPLTLERFMHSPLASGFELLYLQTAQECAVLVALSELQDPTAVRSLLQQAAPGAVLIDRKADFDELFGFFSRLIVIMLSAALLLIFSICALRRGLQSAVLFTGPCLCALGAALALPGLIGFALNFFNLLAAIPVLGMGLNYTIFSANPRSSSSTSALAVVLAMLTSLLTLGILVLSSTAAVAAFGLSLSAGLAAALLLAPLSRKGESHAA